MNAAVVMVAATLRTTFPVESATAPAGMNASSAAVTALLTNNGWL